MITPATPQSKEDVARHYDVLDFFYRDTWGHHVHHGFWRRAGESTEQALLNLADLAITSAHITNGDRVCDIGSGYGATSWLLAEQFHARVTALTVSETQWRVAHDFEPLDSSIPRPSFLLCDWLDNELEDNSFDAAISIECVSHVADKQKFFREMSRVLKPGAGAAVCAWLSSPRPGNFAVKHLLEPICREGRLHSLCTLAEYRDLVKQAGLHVREARDIGPQVRKTWTVIFWRLVRKVLTNERYRAFLFHNLANDRIFALTVLRILLAYRFKCLSYGLLVIRKPADGLQATGNSE